MGPKCLQHLHESDDLALAAVLLLVAGKVHDELDVLADLFLSEDS